MSAKPDYEHVAGETLLGGDSQSRGERGFITLVSHCGLITVPDDTRLLTSATLMAKYVNDVLRKMPFTVKSLRRK